MSDTFFGSVQDNFNKGLSWGLDAAKDTYEATKDGVVQGARATRDGVVQGYQVARDGVVDAYKVTREATVRGYQVARDGVVEGATLVRDGAVVGYTVVRDGVVTVYKGGVAVAKGAVGDATVQAAIAGTQYITGNKARETALVNAVDKRKLYTAKEVCVECQAKAGHPNGNDGKFLGAGCQPSDTVPKTGKLPAGCKAGCKLPRIYFTNGINNTEAQVCDTMSKLAEIKCAEVVGIYNATFADASKVAPPPGSTASVPADKNRPFYRLDQRLGDAVGNQVDAAKHALADKAGRTGLLMDVLDCMDNIDSAGTEAASHTQRQLIAGALATDPPTPITLYAHSQGGLITQEGLSAARQKLYSQQYASLVKGGTANASAKAQAARYADERMANVDVVSFGTAESGWQAGPSYQHYTNTQDPVPALIKQVQSSRGIDTGKTGGPVDSFSFSPSFDPMAAHGMTETYLPRLQEQNPAARTNGKCCP